MLRPAGMSSSEESEDELELSSSVSFFKKRKQICNNDRDINHSLKCEDNSDISIRQDENIEILGAHCKGFDSLSLVDQKDTDGKPNSSTDDNSIVGPVPSKARHSSNASKRRSNRGSKDGSSKEVTIASLENGSPQKTESFANGGHISPPPSSAYYSSSPPAASPSKRAGSRNWRKFRMHEGAAVPLEDFRMAVVNGNLYVVKSLIAQGISVDQILRSGWTALMFAASCAKHEIVRYLLQNGADPNMHKEMFTALMAACASSRENESDLLRCIDLLLTFGAKPDVAERHRMTALMFACKEGRANIVQRLLQANVDVNKQDNKGWTPLCWAATKGYGRVVRQLLEASADPLKANVHGQMPSDIAFAAGHSQLADLLEGATLREKNASPSEVLHDSFSDSCKTSFSVSKIPKNENSEAQFRETELEMVLHGLGLAHLIPLFQGHKVTLECFLYFNENDLEKVGVKEVGSRKKLLEAIGHIHKQEWKTTSLPNLSGLPYITLPEAVAMVKNINKHLRFIHASIGHLRDQIQATPRILQLGQEKHTVATLSNYFCDSLKNLSQLGGEVKFFKAHLDSVCHNAEFTPSDTIVIRQDDGKRWQRRLLTSLAVATSVITVVYFTRPQTFTWLFSVDGYPQRSVFS